MFLQTQNQDNQTKYIKLLSTVGSLSRLQSDNTVPYLYYRSHENIFCLTLDASNESRGDVSVDAVSGTTGIGLKTYIFRNSQYEKVAEFNRLLSSYRGLRGIDLARAIAEARNERINLTSRTYNLENIIYHCIARKEGKFIVHEEAMDLIDLGAIILDAETDKKIDFHDNKNEYRFNFSKSTLYKKFKSEDVLEFDVQIIEDPYTLLLENTLFSTEDIDITGTVRESHVFSTDPCVILPLYSLKGGVNVPERSQLNQWNADGRKRHEDEVYIHIPAWIHSEFSDFFPSRQVPFKLELPGGIIIDAKICQSDDKALMSNPNKELGEWLLRKVLNVPRGTIVTYKMLVKAGIDSVMVTKKSDNLFEIDFKSIGTYEEFKNESLGFSP